MQKVEVTYMKGIKPVNKMMRACDLPAVFLKETCIITFKKRVTAEHVTAEWKKKIEEAFNQAGGEEFEFTDFKFQLIEEL